MPKPKAKEVVKNLVLWLREQGIKIESPYDLENFIADHCSHSQMFATGVFKEDDDDEDS